MQAIVIAAQPEDRDFCSYVLQHAGLAVSRGAEAGQVEAAVREQAPDLVLLVLDRDGDGRAQVNQVRLVTQAPLLLLVEGLGDSLLCDLLDEGADIVLAQPVSPRVLSRYAHVLLRRAGSVSAGLLPLLEAAGLRLDPATHTVSAAGRRRQRLAPLEFRLLYLLMTNRGQVVPTEVIVERVWGYSGSGSRELVRGLVRRVRRKIEPDPAQPRYVENLAGVGYRFPGE